jgi:hypothetical protein
MVTPTIWSKRLREIANRIGFKVKPSHALPILAHVSTCLIYICSYKIILANHSNFFTTSTQPLATVLTRPPPCYVAPYICQEQNDSLELFNNDPLVRACYFDQHGLRIVNAIRRLPNMLEELVLRPPQKELDQRRLMKARQVIFL